MISDTQNDNTGTIIHMSTSKSELSFLLGDRLREERNRINKTQDEMADNFGISVRTWGKYERGETIPDSWMLARLHDYGMDIYYIVTGTKLPVGLNSSDEEKIIKQYRNADETIKFAVKSIFEALKL